MKERPILFSASMIRAILDGSKTQTRRVVKPQFAPDAVPAEMSATTSEGWQTSGHSGRWWCDAEGNEERAIRCPYGKPGDRLWVRETWGYRCGINLGSASQEVSIEYQADMSRHTIPLPQGGEAKLPKQRPCGKDEDYQVYRDVYLRNYWRQWRPSIFMPRWASRIDLEITGVRVERLQDISEADARAEGIKPYSDGTYRDYHVPEDKVFDHYTFASPVDSYRTLWESINGPGSWDANPWVWVIEFRRVRP